MDFQNFPFEIELRIMKMLELPPRDMMKEFEKLYEEHCIFQSDDISKLKFWGLNPDKNVNEDFQKLAGIIAEKTFTEENVKNDLELPLLFINQFHPYLSSEDYEKYVKSSIFRDCEAKRTINEIRTGQCFPDSNPYFTIDPENETMKILLYGMNRGFYTWPEIEKALASQDKESERFKKLYKLNQRIYELDHTPFSGRSGKFNDYGCHLFFGRHMWAGDSRFGYVELSCGGHASLGGENREDLSLVVEHLWNGVRKRRKVLLSKSPGKDFEPFSSDEISELRKRYESMIITQEYESPFKNQPK